MKRRKSSPRVGGRCSATNFPRKSWLPVIVPRRSDYDFDSRGSEPHSPGRLLWRPQEKRFSEAVANLFRRLHARQTRRKRVLQGADSGRSEGSFGGLSV